MAGAAQPGYETLFLTNGASSTYRNFPDVSIAAQNIADIFTSPGTPGPTDQPQAGCSESTALWAGVMALVNQAAQGAGVQSVGFANPVLYGIAGNSSLYASCFNDITSGNNPPNPSSPSGGPQDSSSPAPSGGFSAGPGYDLVTGLGSPTCTLITQLASPTPTARFHRRRRRPRRCRRHSSAWGTVTLAVWFRVAWNVGASMKRENSALG